jgi:hypothetical protein
MQLRIANLGMPLARHIVLLNTGAAQIAALGTSTLAALESVTHGLILEALRMISICALHTLASTGHMLSSIRATGPVTTAGFTAVQRVA